MQRRGGGKSGWGLLCCGLSKEVDMSKENFHRNLNLKNNQKFVQSPNEANRQSPMWPVQEFSRTQVSQTTKAFMFIQQRY